MAGDETGKALAALEAHKQSIAAQTIADFFRDDPNRFERFHIELDRILFDFSKHRLNETTLGLLVNLARAAGVEARRAALFAGEPVNTTEHRPALHMALRNLSGRPMFAEGHDVMPEVLAERAKLEAFAAAVRGVEVKSLERRPLYRYREHRHWRLGPRYRHGRAGAAPYVAGHLRLHTVANVDGADLGDTLKLVPLETTLFVVCSKTFTTIETMTNAATARKIVADTLGEAAVADHFCAVSAQLDKIAAFGIRSGRVFGFWDWVGGRYSIWSSIGLALAIGIGKEGLEEFLLGGQDIWIRPRRGSSPRCANIARAEQQYPPIFRASPIHPRRSGWQQAPRLPPLPLQPRRRRW